MTVSLHIWLIFVTTYVFRTASVKCQSINSPSGLLTDIIDSGEMKSTAAFSGVMLILSFIGVSLFI